MDEEDDGDVTVVGARPVLAAPMPPQARVPHLVRLGEELDGASWALRARMVIGRDAACDVVLDVNEISRRHAEIVTDGARCEIQDLRSRNGTYVNAQRVERAVLSDGDTVQLGAATFRFVYRDSVDGAVIDSLRDRALKDALTGAFNRRYFDQRIASELAYAKRHASPLALVLGDVDHFKRVNDEHGHVAGDAVLREVAARMLKRLRVEDVLARYGGEELAIISRATTVDGACILADRLRFAVGERPIEHGGRRIAVTVSLGVAAVGPTEFVPPEALIERADRALYQAKRAGRNRVVAG